MAEIHAWQNFYGIVGSSAGALIGLQFVVMALISSLPDMRNLPEGGEAFMTPTIVHFGSVLLLAAVISAPWHQTASVALLWGVIGLAGFVYTAIITQRIRRQTRYKPEAEDWIFHSVLPLAAYAGLLAAAFAGFQLERIALFGVAAASLLLLFIGIHNAWDIVAYHVFNKKN